MLHIGHVHARHGDVLADHAVVIEILREGGTHAFLKRVSLRDAIGADGLKHQIAVLLTEILCIEHGGKRVVEYQPDMPVAVGFRRRRMVPINDPRNRNARRDDSQAVLRGAKPARIDVSPKRGVANLADGCRRYEGSRRSQWPGELCRRMVYPQIAARDDREHTADEQPRPFLTHTPLWRKASARA